MTVTRILLIQPRWMTNEMATPLIQAACASRPRALFWLLTPSPAASESFEPLQSLALPVPSHCNAMALLKTVWLVRRRRFAEVIVLTEELRDEHGYAEAKLWAFLARAATRRLGSLRTLRARQEIGEKSRQATVALIERSVRRVSLRRSAATPPSLRRLHSFVWLNEAGKRGAKRGRHLHIGVARSFDQAIARELGWDSDLATPAFVASGALTEKFDMLTWPEWDGRADAAAWPQISAHLTPRGVCLICPQNDEVWSDAAHQSGLEIIDEREALHDERRREVWLRATAAGECAPTQGAPAP